MTNQEREEIREIIRRDYPPGTVFKCAYNTDENSRVYAMNEDDYHRLDISMSTEGLDVDIDCNWIVSDGIRATIISGPNHIKPMYKIY